jgi:phage terminase large subunit-like protein
MLYAGTALERQELHGELLDIVEAALWQPSDIRLATPEFLVGDTLSVIGVDPGLTTGGDATGIVTCRSTSETALTRRHALVIADTTEDGLQPERWAARVVEAWRTEKDLTGTVPVIAAEKNAGGEMIAAVITAEAGENALPIALVPSTRSKAARAEATVMAYRAGRIRHLEGVDLDGLIEEQTTWEPPVVGVSKGSGWSPNRMDAMVVGMRCLLVDDRPLRRFGKLEAQETTEVLHVPTARWRSPAVTSGMRPMPWRSRDDE